MKRIHLPLFTAVLFIFFNCNSINKEESNILGNSQKTLGETTIYKDDFEKNQYNDFWIYEAIDSSRINITDDPVRSDNKVLQVNLKLDDYASGGRRSELRLNEMEPLNYLTNYGFDFLLPESFFVESEKPGIIFLHQWHDQADPGFNWSTQNKVTHPPIRLFIDTSKAGGYKLVFAAGLETGGMNEVIYSTYKEDLQPNRWYSFNCEILWHIYTQTGYAEPKLDGEYLYTDNNEDEQLRHKIYRRNMYNGIGNYFKFGLYTFGKDIGEKTAYFDNFFIETTEVLCD